MDAEALEIPVVFREITGDTMLTQHLVFPTPSCHNRRQNPTDIRTARARGRGEENRGAATRERQGADNGSGRTSMA